MPKNENKKDKNKETFEKPSHKLFLECDENKGEPVCEQPSSLLSSSVHSFLSRPVPPSFTKHRSDLIEFLQSPPTASRSTKRSYSDFTTHITTSTSNIPIMTISSAIDSVKPIGKTSYLSGNSTMVQNNSFNTDDNLSNDKEPNEKINRRDFIDKSNIIEDSVSNKKISLDLKNIVSYSPAIINGINQKSKNGFKNEINNPKYGKNESVDTTVYAQASNKSTCIKSNEELSPFYDEPFEFEPLKSLLCSSLETNENECGMTKQNYVTNNQDKSEYICNIEMMPRSSLQAHNQAATHKNDSKEDIKAKKSLPKKRLNPHNANSQNFRKSESQRNLPNENNSMDKKPRKCCVIQ